MRHKMEAYLIIVIAILRTSISLVQSPPFITKQPPAGELLFQVAQVQEKDIPFTIECEAEGEPTPKFRWMKNGIELNLQANDSRISQQAGKGTLVVHNPTIEDIGQYQCFATNEWGTATSNLVFLRIAWLNESKEEDPVVRVAEEGKPFNLDCNPPVGYPRPDVYWTLLKNNNNGQKNEIMINSSRLTVDPKGTLWFSNITMLDKSSESDSVYACCAKSSIINKSTLCNRRVILLISPNSSAENEHAPVIQYTTRTHQVARKGTTFSLWCIIGGTPLPEVKWTKNGRELPPHVEYQNYGKTLRIVNVDFQDEGQYQCQASNRVGSINHSIALLVVAAPYFTLEPKIQNSTAEGDTVEFKCEFNGKPAPDIYWLHNGKPLEEAEPNIKRRVERNRIILKGISKNETGNYGCGASNYLGYVYKDVYVNVVRVVPNQPMLKNIKCDKRNSTIRWKPIEDNRSPVLDYTIQYNSSFTPDTWKVAYNNVPATETSYTVPVSPWVNYTFRVIARNKIGPSKPSLHSVVCTTPPDVPFKNPENVQGHLTLPSNLVISWTPMQEIDHNAPKFKYQVQWNDGANISWQLEEISDWRISDFVVKKWQPAQPYRIRVKAINEIGESNVTPNVITVYSDQGYPFQEPNDGSNTDINSDFGTPTIELTENNNSTEIKTEDKKVFQVISEEIKIFSVKCSGSTPTKWVFDESYEENNTGLYTINTFEEVLLGPSESIKYSSTLIMNTTILGHLWEGLGKHVLNVSCQNIGSPKNSSVIQLSPCSNCNGTCYQTSFTLHAPSTKQNATHYILSCNASGATLPKYEWIVNNIAINETDAQIETEARDSWASSTLVLGIYDGQRKVSCEADNGVESVWIIAVICLAVLVLVLISSGWIFFKWARKKASEYVRMDIKLFLEGDPNAVEEDGNKDLQAMPYDKGMEIAIQDIEYDKKARLGSGAYGVVYKGTYLAEKVGSNNKQVVAVKTVQPNAEPSYFKALLKELKVITFVGHHKNIVKLIGACTERIYDRDLLIILELCCNGGLDMYLRNNRTALSESYSTPNTHHNIKSLVKWAYEIASGMEYLAMKKVIHADLATRNILLTEDLTAKLCDFGLSRQLYQCSQYKKKQHELLPWRWMAIESLQDMVFSTESDVWSYGVTIWEIFSLGMVPYPGETWTDEFLRFLVSGMRMSKPRFCTEETYYQMQGCWELVPIERPSFKTLKTHFSQLLAK